MPINDAGLNYQAALSGVCEHSALTRSILSTYVSNTKGRSNDARRACLRKVLDRFAEQALSPSTPLADDIEVQQICFEQLAARYLR